MYCWFLKERSVVEGPQLFFCFFVTEIIFFNNAKVLEGPWLCIQISWVAIWFTNWHRIATSYFKKEYTIHNYLQLTSEYVHNECKICIWLSVLIGLFVVEVQEDYRNVSPTLVDGSMNEWYLQDGMLEYIEKKPHNNVVIVSEDILEYLNDLLGIIS